MTFVFYLLFSASPADCQLIARIEGPTLELSEQACRERLNQLSHVYRSGGKRSRFGYVCMEAQPFIDCYEVYKESLR